MRKKLIYLACPYSHNDPIIKQERFDTVNKITARLMLQGMYIYSPLSHGIPIAQYGLSTTWEFWSDQCTTMLSRCDELMVLTLPGWQESRGVQEEISIAQRFGLPISYIND